MLTACKPRIGKFPKGPESKYFTLCKPSKTKTPSKKLCKRKIFQKLTDEIKIQQLSSSHCNKLLGKTDFSVVGLTFCLIQVKN